jgi:putative transposase
VAIAARYKGYRYPIEVIGHAVWLYHRFTLSLRDVEELMLARGVVVTYETILSWCAKFGPDYAGQLRRWRPRPGDKWHLDEVFVKINGTTHYLWRAVDQHSTSSCSRAVTQWRLNGFSASCSWACATCRACW